MAIRKTYIVIFLCVLGLTIYSNTFGNKFVWDDDFLVVKNDYIKSWSNLPLLFNSELRVFSSDLSNYFRPIQSLTYLFDYTFWKLNPIGYHLTNILLHLLVTFLLFKTIEIISKNKQIALLTSLLFLVHPMHTEVNSYISGRADSLAAVFLLVSFLFYNKYWNESVKKIKQIVWFFCSVIFFVLGLLSKEIALVYPVFLLLYEKLILRKEKKKACLSHIIFFFLVLFYTALRLTKLNFLSQHGVSLLNSPVPFFFRLLAAGKTVLIYLKIIFFPVNLHLLRSVTHINQVLSIEAFVSILALLLMTVGGIKLYRHSKQLFFYYIWFFVFLSPALDLFPIGASLAEHFLYLPSMGFFAIISTVAVKTMNVQQPSLVNLKVMTRTGFVLVIALFSIATYNQNKVWKNKIVLYNYHLRFVPDSEVLHNNLGAEYLNLGLRDRAEEEFKQSIVINPKYAYAYNNLGNVAVIKNELEKALGFFKQVAALRPDLAVSYDNLGNIYMKLNKFKDAKAQFDLALKINPKFISTYLNLGILSFNLGNKLEAIDWYKKAIEINGDFIPAYYNLGYIFYSEKDYQNAYSWWSKALKISPNDPYLKKAIENIPNDLLLSKGIG